jgi:hypothetical protein
MDGQAEETADDLQQRPAVDVALDQVVRTDEVAAPPARSHWTRATPGRATTNTPTSRARCPFTDIRIAPLRLGPIPTREYRVARARLSRRRR